VRAGQAAEAWWGAGQEAVCECRGRPGAGGGLGGERAWPRAGFGGARERNREEGGSGRRKEGEKRKKKKKRKRKRKEKWRKEKGGEKERRGREKRESECAGADRGGRSRVGDKPPSGAGRDGDEEKGEGYSRRK